MLMNTLFGPGSTVDYSSRNDDHYLAKVAKVIGANSIFNRRSLIDILISQYSFPDEQRIIMWRYLLHIPMNEKQYTLLAAQQLHPAVRELSNSLPLKYTTIANRLCRLLSALMYWHPSLAECDWLPSLVFPFLRIFERDSLITFEVVATIITNWCQEWLHFVPNPPITVLSRIEKIALDNGGSAPLSVAWPALRSFFAEVATTEAALILLDNIISTKPVFIEYLVASFCLIKGSKVVDHLNVKTVIDRARKLYHKNQSDNPNDSEFKPLPVGMYPVLNIVKKTPMWRDQELNRIRNESKLEQDREEASNDIEREAARIERQRRNWIAERAILRQIEEEQMEEFRRREKEILVKENQKEELALQIRREQLRRRRIEEENAIEEWKRDCAKIQSEMRQVVDTRRATWARWIALKEDAAKLAQEEVESELELLRQRDKTHLEACTDHGNLINMVANEEQELLAKATAKSAELEEERAKLRQTLENARRRQAQIFKARQKELF